MGQRCSDTRGVTFDDVLVPHAVGNSLFAFVFAGHDLLAHRYSMLRCQINFAECAWRGWCWLQNRNGGIRSDTATGKQPQFVNPMLCLRLCAGLVS